MHVNSGTRCLHESRLKVLHKALNVPEVISELVRHLSLDAFELVARTSWNLRTCWGHRRFLNLSFYTGVWHWLCQLFFGAAHKEACTNDHALNWAPTGKCIKWVKPWANAFVPVDDWDLNSGPAIPGSWCFSHVLHCKNGFALSQVCWLLLVLGSRRWAAFSWSSQMTFHRIDFPVLPTGRQIVDLEASIDCQSDMEDSGTSKAPFTSQGWLYQRENQQLGGPLRAAEAKCREKRTCPCKSHFQFSRWWRI